MHDDRVVPRKDALAYAEGEVERLEEALLEVAELLLGDAAELGKERHVVAVVLEELGREHEAYEEEPVHGRVSERDGAVACRQEAVEDDQRRHKHLLREGRVAEYPADVVPKGQRRERAVAVLEDGHGGRVLVGLAAVYHRVCLQQQRHGVAVIDELHAFRGPAAAINAAVLAVVAVQVQAPEVGDDALKGRGNELQRDNERLFECCFAEVERHQLELVHEAEDGASGGFAGLHHDVAEVAYVEDVTL